MQIHQIKNTLSKKRKRIGRGGKRGTYSGRGIKGQKSRSGHSQRPTFEGGHSTLVAHTKKSRGFKSNKIKIVAINLGRINDKFKDDEIVNGENLFKKGLLSKKNIDFKVLSDGKIDKKLIFDSAVKMSEKAKSKIEKAGGKLSAVKK